MRIQVHYTLRDRLCIDSLYNVTKITLKESRVNGDPIFFVEVPDRMVPHVYYVRDIAPANWEYAKLSAWFHFVEGWQEPAWLVAKGMEG